jgi:uncharacterized protein (DUF2267 family)
MDELVKLVVERASLNPQVARLAVEAVLSGLKAKLPAPVAAQIDAALSSDAAGNVLGNVAKGLGGLFGKK